MTLRNVASECTALCIGNDFKCNFPLLSSLLWPQDRYEKTNIDNIDDLCTAQLRPNLYKFNYTDSCKLALDRFYKKDGIGPLSYIYKLFNDKNSVFSKYNESWNKVISLSSASALNLPIEEDQNPALGWRGIRVCIDQPNILKTQLRAMIIANQEFGNLEIMLPMVSRLEEVLIVKRILNEALKEVAEQTGKEVVRPRFGVMIEVPCVAFILNELAAECDFFSIGSNDLIQYLFAADRSNPKVSKIFDPFNPAAVRCLKYLIDRTTEVGKPLSVCGELAGSPVGSLLLMSLGYSNLSMNYSQIARVKYIARHVNLQDLLSIGKMALTLNSSVKIKSLYIEYAKSQGLSSVIDPKNYNQNRS